MACGICGKGINRAIKEQAMFNLCEEHVKAHKCKKCGDLMQKTNSNGLCSLCDRKKSEDTNLFDEMNYVYTPPQGLGPNPYLGEGDVKQPLQESLGYTGRPGIANLNGPKDNLPYEELDSDNVALYNIILSKTGFRLDIHWDDVFIGRELTRKFSLSPEAINKNEWTIKSDRNHPPITAIIRVDDRDEDGPYDDMFIMISRDQMVWDRQVPNYRITVAEGSQRLSNSYRITELDFMQLNYI
jgi:hypothetical protein